MKKVLLFVVALTLSVAAAAYAQSGQTNKYTVEASTSPTNKGSASKPVPVGIKFGYKVGTVEGTRPIPVKKYSIRFDGLRVNTNQFPGCSQAQLQASKARCVAARVGSGFVKNQSGASNNPNDKSIVCNLQLTVYNSKNNKGLLLLEGGPGQPTQRECPIEFGTSNGVIPTNYVRSARGVALEFTVPQNLLHPLASLDNSVVDVNSTIARRTVRSGGKTVGYFESVGGCTNRRRTVTVTFSPERGPTSRASSPAACK